MVKSRSSSDKIMIRAIISFFFFFNDTATTEIYTLSLHDALPICAFGHAQDIASTASLSGWQRFLSETDRKSTRLNSSHLVISYAVFCLKKKKMIYLHTVYHLHVLVIRSFLHLPHLLLHDLLHICS